MVAATMKGFTCLYLTLFTAHLVLADFRNGENFIYIDARVWPSHLRIPANSYWQGIRPTQEHPNFWGTWKYKSIQFKKDIPTNSTITIDYVVEYEKSTWFTLGTTWETLYYGSELLCETHKLDSSIGALVRQVLGLAKGCPVSAGAKRKTIKSHVPQRMYHLELDSITKSYIIRILTEVYEIYGSFRETLFSGQFEMVYSGHYCNPACRCDHN